MHAFVLERMAIYLGSSRAGVSLSTIETTESLKTK